MENELIFVCYLILKCQYICRVQLVSKTDNAFAPSYLYNVTARDRETDFAFWSMSSRRRELITS